MLKGVRITLVVEADEAEWGFLDVAEGLHGDDRVAAVIELAREDLGSLLEDAEWRVTFLEDE